MRKFKPIAGLKALFQPIPYPPPPSKAEDYETWLRWQAGNPNLHLGIRRAASQTLAALAKRRSDEARLRRVVYEAVRNAMIATDRR